MVNHSYYTASITGTPYKWVRISGHFSLPITSPDMVCIDIHNYVFFKSFSLELPLHCHHTVPEDPSSHSWLRNLTASVHMVIRNLFIAYCMQGYFHTVIFSHFFHFQMVLPRLEVAQTKLCLSCKSSRVKFACWHGQKGQKLSLYTVIFHSKIKETDLMVCLKMTFDHDPIFEFIFWDMYWKMIILVSLIY